MVVQLLLVMAAYLLGSINSAILISRATGLPDPRTQGSRNPGATNVLRTGNKFAAAITLVGDLLKGFIAVFCVNTIMGSGSVTVAVGIAALLGHMYPVYYRFKGGKGVATTLGVLLGIDAVLGVLWMTAWLTTAGVFRYSSLAALTATLVTAWSVWLFLSPPAFVRVLMLVVTVLIFWRHRSNIRDLYSGNEEKIGRP